MMALSVGALNQGGTQSLTENTQLESNRDERIVVAHTYRIVVAHTYLISLNDRIYLYNNLQLTNSHDN